MRMHVPWLAYTGLDLQFEISRLEQLTEETFKQDATAHIKRLNTIVKYAHENIEYLPFPKLELHSIRIAGYSDAAFADNYDATSQLGRIILLVDYDNPAAPIDFKSHKSRRVMRSVFSAKVTVFADLFESDFSIRSQIEHAIRRSVPMYLLTYSESLFDIMGKCSRTGQKRIMSDIRATCQA